jgi:hypothetical protein
MSHAPLTPAELALLGSLVTLCYRIDESTDWTNPALASEGRGLIEVWALGGFADCVDRFTTECTCSEWAQWVYIVHDDTMPEIHHCTTAEIRGYIDAYNKENQ